MDWFAKFTRWFQRKPPEKVVLLVMHAADMVRVHPETDWSRTCSQCGARVGIYPSGQDVLRRRPDVIIICNRCEPNKSPIILPSGALLETYQSRPRSPDDPT
jgi:hypothetical protein